LTYKWYNGNKGIITGMKTTKCTRFFKPKWKHNLSFKFKLWNKKNKNKNTTCEK
jgi:hypothetical protein